MRGFGSRDEFSMMVITWKDDLGSLWDRIAIRSSNARNYLMRNRGSRARHLKCSSCC